jgi:serine/threonine protein kinase
LRAEAFREQRLLDFCVQTARGLEYLASQRVLHRDLAARNVLLAQDQTCNLTDFGLAREIPDDGDYDVHSAIPVRHSAPEVLREKTASTASDVYSLAITFWEIFTSAAVPYAHIGNNTAVVAAVATGERPERPGNLTNDNVWALMQRAWVTDSQQRPSASEIVDILTDELTGANSASHSGSESSRGSSNAYMNESDESAYQDGYQSAEHENYSRTPADTK